MERFSKKIYKHGNSFAVIVPYWIVRALDIKVGDMVYVGIDTKPIEKEKDGQIQQ